MHASILVLIPHLFTFIWELPFCEMKESKSTLNWICNALQFITHRQNSMKHSYHVCRRRLEYVDKDDGRDVRVRANCIVRACRVCSVFAFSNFEAFIYGWIMLLVFIVLRCFIHFKWAGVNDYLVFSPIPRFHWISVFALCVSKQIAS